MSASLPSTSAGEPLDLSLADVDLPVPPPAPVRPAPPPPPPPVVFPLGEMLSIAPPSIQYRIIADVIGDDAASVPALASLPLASRAGLRLAVAQQADGGWGGGLLGVPGGSWEGFAGVGFLPGVRRLLELGWGAESPPLAAARRLLFRLVAEDPDPALLGEFGGLTDPLARGERRQAVREAAAVALAQAGFEGDPRLRGAVRRMLDRVHAFLRSPLAGQGGEALLAAAGTEQGPPTRDLLAALGFMPRFRSEHHQLVDRLLHWLSTAREVPAAGGRRGASSGAGRAVFGDPIPSAEAVAADVPAAVSWLELVGRLGGLRRGGGWAARLEELLAARDAAGWWRPPAGWTPPTGCDDPARWPSFTLGDDPRRIDWSLEVTFRLALVARLAGRSVTDSSASA